ncbi:MAG: 2Fe-2S iron-sulfur cluster-binding protein [Pseudomonadota bacterium]
MSDGDLKIFVTDLNGVEHELPALEGWRVMEIIKDAGLPLKAECGGACCCATCHVYVDAEWQDKLIDKTDEEEDMLDEAMDVEENSRLSCQILMRDDLDGLKVNIAPGTEP